MVVCGFAGVGSNGGIDTNSTGGTVVKVLMIGFAEEVEVEVSTLTFRVCRMVEEEEEEEVVTVSEVTIAGETSKVIIVGTSAVTTVESTTEASCEKTRAAAMRKTKRDGIFCIVK
jgi:hypothetical protein